MPNLGIAELAIIGVIMLLIFGPKRLPGVGRSLGQAIKEFRGVGRELAPDDDDDR